MKVTSLLLTASVAGLLATSAFGAPLEGSLVFDNQFGQSGTGFGTVLAVTTAHRTDGGGPNGVDNTSVVESSCIGRVAGGAETFSVCGHSTGVIGGSHSGTTPPQNETYTMTALLSELGIDSISEIGLVVNPSQTGANPYITLTALYFSIYNPTTGEVLYEYEWFGTDQILNADNLGIGGQGFGFRIANADLAGANVFNGDWVVGAGVSFLNWDDGPDTVNIARYVYEGTCPVNEPTCDVGEVPEPSSMLLMGGGLLGLAFWRRRKNS